VGPGLTDGRAVPEGNQLLGPGHAFGDEEQEAHHLIGQHPGQLFGVSLRVHGEGPPQLASTPLPKAPAPGPSPDPPLQVNPPVHLTGQVPAPPLLSLPSRPPPSAPSPTPSTAR